MKRNANYFQRSVVILIVSWMLLFIFLPNIMLFVASFLRRDETNFIAVQFTLDNYLRLFEPVYLDVLLHSLKMAAIATLTCLLIGYPFAWCLTRFTPRVRAFLLFLLIIPFWTNSLLRIYALKLFLSTNGLLNQLLLSLGVVDHALRIIYTPFAVILGLVYILLPFMVMPLFVSIEKLDNSCIEAARDLGANKLQTFIRIILPLTLPGIISGSLLVMLPALGMFYIADLLGGAKNLLIGNIIKNQFLSIRDWPFGAATSIILTLLLGVMLTGYWRTTRLLNQRGELE